MRTYDVTLKGFDGSGRNDHLVKWVQAPSEEVVRQWLQCHLLPDHVESITDLGDMYKHAIFADGLDVMLSDRGGDRPSDIEYLPGLWQVVVEPFDAKTWIEESQAAIRDRDEDVDEYDIKFQQDPFVVNARQVLTEIDRDGATIDSVRALVKQLFPF